MRQLSEIREKGFVEVDPGLGLIGKAQLLQPLYLGDDLWDVLCGPCIVVYISDTQSLHIFHIPLLESPGQSAWRDALLSGTGDDLIVDIGDVLQIKDAVAPVLEISGHHIKGNVGSGMADVRIVINCGTADEEIDPSAVNGL
jgi:hypothetical protein